MWLFRWLCTRAAVCGPLDPNLSRLAVAHFQTNQPDAHAVDGTSDHNCINLRKKIIFGMASCTPCAHPANRKAEACCNTWNTTYAVVGPIHLHEWMNAMDSTMQQHDTASAGCSRQGGVGLKEVIACWARGRCGGNEAAKPRQKGSKAWQLT